MDIQRVHRRRSCGRSGLLPGSAAITPQAQPPGYPDYSLPEPTLAPNGYPIAYAVSGTVSQATANRTAIMTALGTLPSLSIVGPPRLLFDRDSGGNYACSLNAGSVAADPACTEWQREVSVEWLAVDNPDLAPTARFLGAALA